MRVAIFYSFLVLSFWACKNEVPPNTLTQRGYYFWKSDFDMSNMEKEILTDSLSIKRLYIKYFDIVWDDNQKAAKPVASLRFNTIPPPDIDIVPTVFITNETFLGIEDSAVVNLAQRVATKIQDKNKLAGIENKIQEWQFDCDWSGKTKDNYFLFLETIQKLVPTLKLSATIRLFQVKYPKKAGVPPVSRGMLMLYNMDKVSDIKTRNSILDIGVTKTYIKETTTYPLPLDLALPTFAWAAAFKGNKMTGILNNITERELAGKAYWRKTKENNYICDADTIEWDIYWRRGDYLRLEKGNIEDIKALKSLTTALRAKNNLNIVLYHWDTKLYQYYGKQSLVDIYTDY